MTYDKDITPYIHVFIYHAPYFAHKYGGLKSFETEALEQLNYVNKLVFFGASNKGKENYSVTEQVWLSQNISENFSVICSQFRKSQVVLFYFPVDNEGTQIAL